MFSDGQIQRGMDRYLDSLFDPVLADNSAVSPVDIKTSLQVSPWKHYSCTYQQAI